MLDILGFKRMIAEIPLTTLAQKYDRLISHADSLNYRPPINETEISLFPGHATNVPYCKRFIFSDSIILVAHEDNAISCLKLIVHTWRLFQTMISQQIPVRGAIACGDMYIDESKSIFLGSALTAAYELEQQQNWIGVALDPSVENYYPELFPKEIQSNSIWGSFLRWYDVPVKIGHSKQLRTLNWRWNLVVERGTRSLFPSAPEAEANIKVQNTLAYAADVVRGGSVYAEDQSKCPLELRCYWIGAGTEPPFPHGDDL